MEKYNPNSWKWILGFIILLILGYCHFLGNKNSITQSDSTPVHVEYAHENVYNNPNNGSVSQIIEYFNATLNDPESLKIVEWGNVGKNKDGSFIVRCKYRAKNPFGAYILKNQIFIIDSAGYRILRIVDL